MTDLAEIQKSVDQLSAEDRMGLLSHLLHTLDRMPLGADDDEVLRREADMDAGRVRVLSHRKRSGRRFRIPSSIFFRTGS